MPAAGGESDGVAVGEGGAAAAGRRPHAVESALWTLRLGPRHALDAVLRRDDVESEAETVRQGEGERALCADQSAWMLRWRACAKGAGG